MDSLATLKADQGKGGSELQLADITRLRRELEIKQDKINDLRQVSLWPAAPWQRGPFRGRPCCACGLSSRKRPHSSGPKNPTDCMPGTAIKILLLFFQYLQKCTV